MRKGAVCERVQPQNLHQPETIVYTSPSLQSTAQTRVYSEKYSLQPAGGVSATATLALAPL